MHKIIISIVLLAVSIIGYARSIPKNEKQQEINTSIYALEINGDEEKVGRYLINFIGHLRKNRINKTLLKQLFGHKSIDDFGNLKEELRWLRKLLKSEKSVVDIALTCNQINRIGDKGYIYFLSYEIMRICRKKFIDAVLDTKKFNLLQNDSLKFLDTNLVHYLKNKKYRFKIVKMLRDLKDHPSVLKSISHLLYQKTIKKEINLSGFNLELLQLDLNEMRKLKKVNISTSDMGAYFNTEFMKKINHLDRVLKDGEFEYADYLITTIKKYRNEHRKINFSKKVWNKIKIVAKRILLKYGLTDAAMNLYELAINIAPEKYRNESYYLYLWANIIARRYKENLQMIDKYALLQKFNSFDTRLKFWIAYSFEKNKLRLKADKLYGRITDSSSLSYYSIIALQKLYKRGKGKSGNKFMDDIGRIYSGNIIKLADCDDITVRAFRRLHLWSRLSYEKFIRKEVDYLIKRIDEKLLKNKELKSNKQYVRLIISNITRLFNYREQYINTFKLLDKVMSADLYQLSDNLLKRLFPFNYLDDIEEFNQKLDPIVILSLIRQESAFNPMARSPAGARGLMQLMPSTARMVHKKRIKRKKLYLPRVNLKIGIKYFENLYGKYKGDLISTLAAYNAGETALRRWKRDYLHSDDPLANVEAIPYQETRRYVQLIYRNIFFYKILNQKMNISKVIPSDFYVKYKFMETSAH